MQRGSTRERIFDVPALVEFASAVAPLEVGERILTGTPAGVGVFWNPPVFLRPGDRRKGAIEGIGALEMRFERAGSRE